MAWDHPSASYETTRDLGQRSGPRVMASLAIAILRLTGHASIAAALRHHARQPGRPLQTIMHKPQALHS